MLNLQTLDPARTAGLLFGCERPSGRSSVRLADIFLEGERSASLFHPAGHKLVSVRLGVNPFVSKRMDFKEASSRLTDGHTLADIAAETGMSEATVRRARLDPSSPAYRSPPPNWKEAIIRLAEQRIESLRALISMLRR
jgi:hypothetical protein